MRRAYGAERMVLVAAGNVEHAAVVGLAERLFGGLAREGGAGTRPADYRGGERRETRDLEQAHLPLGFPGIAYHDADFYAVSVMRSEEHTSELQSLMRTSYAGFCLKKKKNT